MKKLAFAAVIFIFSGILTMQAEARPDKRFDKGTETCRVFTFEGNWAGYKTFTNTCKTCHSRKNDKGAPFLFTESKTSNGWNRVFEKKYPACARSGAWEKLNQDDLLKLNDFLFANGMGTYNANTDCG